MRDNFDRALAFVLKYEGGYSDHPSDPGGATKYGITHHTLSAHREQRATKDDVRALTMSETSEIYRERYWSTALCDAFPTGIDLAVFDCAVNQGTGRAKRLLQQSVNVKIDGIIGPITCAAVSAAPQEKLLTEFMARRMRAYGSLRRLFKTFGLGWSRRLMACHAEALALLSTGE